MLEQYHDATVYKSLFSLPFVTFLEDPINEL